MDEVAELTRKLSDYIKQRGAVYAEELAEWGRKEGLTSVVLYILLQEILKTGSYRASADKKIIDPIFRIEIPGQVEYVENVQESTPLKPAQVHEEKRRPRRPATRKTTKGPSLLVFLERGEEAQEGPEAYAAAEKAEGVGSQKSEASPQEPLQKPQEVQLPPQEAQPQQIEKIPEPLAIKEMQLTPEVEAAVRYLGRYWSVGLLRLLDDLSRMGVREPRKVVAELARKGLVEVSELEVVNAKKELVEFAKKLIKDKNIADIFLS
jgi:hypothetical protein